MKKRRTLIITALLLAALVLGIGYAALSRELVIGSEANLAPNEKNFDIVFTSAGIDNSDYGSASLTGDQNNATTAHYTLTGLSAQGDKAVMTFVIKNRTNDLRNPAFVFSCHFYLFPAPAKRGILLIFKYMLRHTLQFYPSASAPAMISVSS